MKHLPGWELFLFIQPNSIELKSRFKCQAAICPMIRTLNDYNRFMTDVDFWDKLKDYDRVLIFQQDSMILRGGIEEFLEWDYVGAPWAWQPEPKFGGNGGLSLRNPKKCLTLCQEKPYNPSYGYEDVYFTNNLDNVAPYEVCRKFSCETIFEMGTLGYHAIEKYMTPDKVAKIKTQYD